MKNQIYIFNKTASNFGALKDFEKQLKEKEHNEYLERCYGEAAWKVSRANQEEPSPDSRKSVSSKKKMVAALNTNKYEIKDEEEEEEGAFNKPVSPNIPNRQAPLDDSADSEKSPVPSDDSNNQSDDDNRKNKAANKMQIQELKRKSSAIKSVSNKPIKQQITLKETQKKKDRSYDSMGENSDGSENSPKTLNNSKLRSSTKIEKPNSNSNSDSNRAADGAVYNFSSAPKTTPNSQVNFSIKKTF